MILLPLRAELLFTLQYEIPCSLNIQNRRNDTSSFSLRNIKVLTNMVQTALTVVLFWTILKLTPKSALMSLTILYLILWQYQLWSFMFRDTKSNRPLPKKEAFQSIFWYILKWNDGEPSKFGQFLLNKLFQTWHV